MTNDLKATVTGIVTGIATLLAVFGFNLTPEWISIIVAIGTVVLAYFTNKKDN